MQQTAFSCVAPKNFKPSKELFRRYEASRKFDPISYSFPSPTSLFHIVTQRVSISA